MSKNLPFGMAVVFSTTLIGAAAAWVVPIIAAKLIGGTQEENLAQFGVGVVAFAFLVQAALLLDEELEKAELSLRFFIRLCIGLFSVLLLISGFVEILTLSSFFERIFWVCRKLLYVSFFYSVGAVLAAVWYRFYLSFVKQP